MKTKLYNCWSWSHPFKSIKRIKDRIVYGYCDMDAWNVDSYLGFVIPGILSTLAANTHSFPGNDKFPTAESWEDKLEQVARDLARARDWEKWENPYRSAWEKSLCNIKFEDGVMKTSDENKILNKEYLYVEADNHSKAVALRNMALDFIRDNWEDLWD